MAAQGSVDTEDMKTELIQNIQQHKQYMRKEYLRAIEAVELQDGEPELARCQLKVKECQFPKLGKPVGSPRRRGTTGGQ